MKRKLLTENSRVSSRTFGYYKNTTGLSFAEEGLGHLLQLLLLSFIYSHFIYSLLKTCLLVFTVIPWSKLLINNELEG
jgi:hypothetical protein